MVPGGNDAVYTRKAEMDASDTPVEPGGVGMRAWLKRNYPSLLMLLFVVGIVVGLFVFFLRNPEKVEEFQGLGYLGAFLITLVTTATVILPFPGTVALFPLGATFNPLLVGLAGGVGGGIGEMTSYLAGYSGRGIWQSNRNYQNAVRWLQRWGSVLIFVFAATPLPIDLVGIVAGNLRFPFWKFLIACWLGKTVQYLGMAYMGFWGWDSVVSQQWDIKALSCGAGAGAAVLLLLVLALALEKWTWRRGR